MLQAVADTYILDRGHPRRVEDPAAWVTWMRRADRVVAQERVGEWDVVTVFGGVDMRPVPDSRHPLVFQTAIREGNEDVSVVRTGTWTDALQPTP